MSIWRLFHCTSCYRGANPLMFYPIIHHTLLQLLLLHHAFALPSNRTVDDEYGDEVTGLKPEYKPSPSSWIQGSTCGGCHAKADASKAWRGTWHDTTYHPGDPELRSMSIPFNGTAMYAYCILANSIPSTDTITNLTFSVDGQHVGTFFHSPDPSADYTYNVLVYSNNSLSNTQHLFTLETISSTPSLVLFDYLTYTFESDATSSSSSTSASQSLPTTASPSHLKRGGIAAVGFIGGALFVGIVICALLLLRRKLRRSSNFNDPGHYEVHTQLPESRQVYGSSPGMLDQHAHPPPLPVTDFTPRISSGAAAFNDGSMGAVSTPLSLRNAPMTPDSHAKQATSQEELFRQVRDMEETMANLQLQQQNTIAQRSPVSRGSVGSSPMTSAENDASLVGQIKSLKREMERLQAQQRQMMLRSGDAPPPGYALAYEDHA